MCPGNEPDSRRRLGHAHPHLEPHQLDAHGDPHVAYLRPLPGETPEVALECRFRRYDDAGYCRAIAGLGLARVARDEYRCLIATRALDDRVSPLDFALGDVFGQKEGGIAVVTVDEIARQFVLLGWAPDPEEGADAP